MMDLCEYFPKHDDVRHRTITALGYSQDEVLVPGWVEGLGFVAGVVSGVRVGRQVEGAEGVAQPRDVLAAQVPRPVHLQVTLQIRLLHTRRIDI